MSLPLVIGIWMFLSFEQKNLSSKYCCMSQNSRKQNEMLSTWPLGRNKPLAWKTDNRDQGKGWNEQSKQFYALRGKHWDNKYKWQVFTIEATNGTSVGKHIKHWHWEKYKSDAFHTSSLGAGEQMNSWPSNVGERYCFSFWVIWIKQSACCSGPWHETAMVYAPFPWQSLTHRSFSPAGRAGLSLPSPAFCSSSSF